MEQYDKFLTDNNNIFLNGEIDQKIALEINQKLIYLDRLKLPESQDLIEKGKSPTPVWFWINSNGGSIINGLSIIDTMEIMHMPIYTVIVGMAYSMAAIISISGDKRLATRNSSWMMHDSYGEHRGYSNKLDAQLNHNKKLEEKLMDILKKKTKLRKKQYDVASHYDLYLDSEECKEFKIIDDILCI